ncbi:putative tuliposide A-converting enzyme 1, chloroplastic [Iris pallida]|uniref:Tuliposide A-converting enzyme 1, chloroplastic n=1 Tax=Iris pallida TaxID=29817 RepID=A0AAX6GNM0_IRIPA|nr:putative tuliposide A-converting enzyme 1, chloroplastic [Iris pallida]
MADGAEAELAGLRCRRVMVEVAEKDVLKAVGVAYREALARTGGVGRWSWWRREGGPRVPSGEAVCAKARSSWTGLLLSSTPKEKGVLIEGLVSLDPSDWHFNSPTDLCVVREIKITVFVRPSFRNISTNNSI